MDNRDNLLNFQNKVNLYFDKALAQEEEQDLMNQIKVNPECNRVFNTEKKYRDFVQKNVKRPGASPDLVKMIKKNLPF